MNFWQLFVEELNSFLVLHQSIYEDSNEKEDLPSAADIKLENVPETSISKENISVKESDVVGKVLFKELLNNVIDISQQNELDGNKTILSNHLTNRFVTSISAAITGFDRNQQDIEKVADEIIKGLKEKFSNNKELKIIFDQAKVSNVQKLKEIEQQVKDKNWKDIENYVKEYYVKNFEQQIAISEREEEQLKVLISEASSQLV